MTILTISTKVPNLGLSLPVIFMKIKRKGTVQIYQSVCNELL